MVKRLQRDVEEVPLISLHGVWKVFDGVPVLKGIDFDINPGEIHALLGGNGSGKSTIVKILSGAYQTTAGKIEIEGNTVNLSGPSDAHAQGIYMVPQEPHVFPNLSVLENLTIGLSGDPATNAHEAARLAHDIGMNVDLALSAGHLTIANQQLVEIVRGLLREVNVLVLDEPTSSLTSREVERLAEQMRALSDKGIGILFISHRLSEVLEFADRVSVLRDGNFVLSEPVANLNAEMLVESMLPAEFNAPEETATPKTHKTKQEPVLEVINLSANVFHNISFEVYPGEILGISGVVGSGRTELAEAVYGIDTQVQGEIRICGVPVEKNSPRSSQQMGLAYVPEDRHKHGVFLSLAAAQNISASMISLPKARYLGTKKEFTLARSFVERLRIKLASPQQTAGTLSGGNQQKLVLAKMLAPEPRVMILDEPTRGIDARARQDVYRIIRELTSKGVGVVVISSEVAEIAEIADRILIMTRGRLWPLPPQLDSVEQISAATMRAMPPNSSGVLTAEFAS